MKRFLTRRRRNRRLNWVDKSIEALIGSRRNPLLPMQVLSRCTAILIVILPFVVWEKGMAVKQLALNFNGRRVAAKADVLRLSGHSEQALSLLSSVVPSCRQEPAVIRGLAWASAESFPNHAAEFITRLNDLDQTTVDDQLLLASLHMRLGSPEKTAAIIEGLVKNHSDNPDVWRAWAAACTARGEHAEALRACNRVLRLVPDDLQSTASLATLMLRSGAAKDKRAAIALLLRQLERAVDAGLPAAQDIADMLLNISTAENDQRSAFAASLRRIPDLAPGKKIAAVFLAHPVTPDAEQGARRRAELKAVTASLGDLTPKARAEVSKHFLQHNEHALLLDWASTSEAVGDKDIFTARIEALLASGQWRAAAEMARHPAAAEFEYDGGAVIEAFTILSSGKESPSVASKLISHALEQEQHAKHHAACAALGYAALDHALYPLAARAFGAAIAGDTHGLCPLDDYMMAARRGGDRAASALSIIATRARATGADPALQKQSIYLRLLCGDELERAALDLSTLKKATPEDPYLKFLDAFMRFRFSDHLGAISALLPLPKHKWHQGETVVISAMLASGGKMREAAILAGKVSGSGIFPEELELLRSSKGITIDGSGLISSVMR